MVDIAAGSAVSIEKYPRPPSGGIRRQAPAPGGPGSPEAAAARGTGGRGCQDGSWRWKRRSESIE